MREKKCYMEECSEKTLSYTEGLCRNHYNEDINKQFNEQYEKGRSDFRAEVEKMLKIYYKEWTPLADEHRLIIEIAKDLGIPERVFDEDL